MNEYRRLCDAAIEVGNRFPGNSGFIFAYDEPLSHLVYAAADMLLVPSMFEPCGRGRRLRVQSANRVRC